jgi:hypothetical protein
MGVWDFFKNTAKGIWQNLHKFNILDNPILNIIQYFRGDNFGAEGREVLQKHYGKRIIAISANKQPLNGLYQNLLNLLSLGKFQSKQRELRYEDIYHLRLLITLEDKTIIRFEKTNTAEVAEYHSSGGWTMPITTSYHGTINEFVDNTKAYMDGKFYTYSADTNNCQIFVLSALKANNIPVSPTAQKFIYQSADQLVGTLPAPVQTLLQQMFNFATKIDPLIHG